jgi:predicted PurR-regulated permease PerM
LLILRVPLALPLTVLTFFGGLVPIVGALFAGAVAVLVALVANGPTTALIVLGLILLVQQLEGNVLSPMLQGRSLSLHPGLVILAVTAGSTLFGIVGAFLAVPTVAVVAQALRYLDELADATAAAAKKSANEGPPAPVRARPAPAGALVARVAPIKRSFISRLPNIRR